MSPGGMAHCIDDAIYYPSRCCCLCFNSCCTCRRCYKVHCTLCTVFTYIIVIAGILPYVGFAFFNWRANSPSEVRPEDRGISHYHRVSFPSIDGDFNLDVTISAVHFEHQMPEQCDTAWLQFRKPSHADATVVAVHGVGSCAMCFDSGSSVLYFAVQPLLCAGFQVLTPDLRNHGQSSNAAPVTAGYREARDVLASIRWLMDVQGLPPHRIYLWGMSLGAAAAGYAASLFPLCRAVALEAPPASTAMVYGGFENKIPSWAQWWTAFWHKTFSLSDPYTESLLKEARFIRANVLHSHGRQDHVVPFSNAEALRFMFEARASIVDDLTGRVHRPNYTSFFHDGAHVSSWIFPTYFERMLQLFSDAAAATDAAVVKSDADVLHASVQVEHTLAQQSGDSMIAV